MFDVANLHGFAPTQISAGDGSFVPLFELGRDKTVRTHSISTHTLVCCTVLEQEDTSICLNHDVHGAVATSRKVKNIS